MIDAVRQVKLRPRERITFEYVLLGGVTDRPEDAGEVARLIRRTGLPAKVNLIAWNPGPGIEYATPKPEAVEAFRQALVGRGHSGLRAQAARARHLRRLRAVEAHGGGVRSLPHLKIEMWEALPRSPHRIPWS